MKYADGPEVTVEIDIEAPPEKVWAVATDLTRMGEWSGENQGGTWVEGDGPKLGAVFEGVNRHERVGEWKTLSYVTECEEPTSFSWTVHNLEDPAAVWRFDLEPTETGTKLRQHVRMGPGFSGLSMAIDAQPDKEDKIIARRQEEHRANMTATVEGIKAAAEAS